MDTLAAPVSSERVIKRSRFVCRAAPVASEAEALVFLEEVRDPGATHNVWAFRLGKRYRFSDDGEPAGTAGRPVLSAIEAQDLDQVVVVVTRYFGGIKLGASGLVRAYRGVASECLRAGRRRPIVYWQRLWVRLPWGVQSVLYPVLARHGGRKLEERYGDAAEFLVELPKAAVEAFTRDLGEETRGRAVVQPVA